MRCKDFEERISAYLDNELPIDQTAFFEQHMVLCQQCRTSLDGVRQVRAALAGLGAASAPAVFQLRLAECLQEGVERTSLWLRSLVLGMALAAALAIVLWPQASDREQLRQIAAPATNSWAVQSRIWAASDPQPELVLSRYAASSGRNRYSHAHVRLAAF